MKSEQEKYREFSRYVQTDAEEAKKLKKSNRSYKGLIITLSIIAVIAALVLFWVFGICKGEPSLEKLKSLVRFNSERTVSEGESALEEITEVMTEEPETELQFNPHATEATAPEVMMEFTELELNGEPIAKADFEPWYDMNFGEGNTYTNLEGVLTFRGNNFRDMPAYGNAGLKDHKIIDVWQHDTGGLSYNGASWTGSGWTGQPLMVKWPRATKQHMNMAEWAKEDDELVEVIYACMDGYVYFYDMRSGEPTRDKLYLGWTFKGSGALDPRGYPIMYVGAGYNSDNGIARVFVINLLDCSTMYTFGNADEFSLRGQLSFFDSSALVDAESDTLIYPGENGILYLIHLNTQYDEAAGTLSIDPDNFLKWRYKGYRNSLETYWYGMEDSAAIYKGYLFIADNGGHLMCLNLNTMELVWVQDILDDSNSTPVLANEDGHLYLYISTSFRLGMRSDYTANVPIWKIDAETGEIVWQKDYECMSMKDGDGQAVSGGVQSTIAIGQDSLKGNIYVTVSMVGDTYSGVLACIDRKTGNVRWERKSAYAWSSPVCVYDEKGMGDVLYCDASGKMYILDGITGEVLDTKVLSEGVIEASPAVYDNYVVVGTRASKIWGLQLQ